MKKQEMKPIPRSGALLLALIVSLGLPRALRATEFLYLGDLPGGSEYSIALGVSADGTYVVGGSSSESSGPVGPFLQPTEAFVWDKARGMVALGDMPGGRFISMAHAVTSNGNLVVGASEELNLNATVRTAPFLWSRGGTMARLGPTITHERLDGGGAATGITSDGKRVIGSMWWLYFGGGFGNTFASRGFFWDSPAPLTTLSSISIPSNNFDPAPSTASAVNSRGTIAGADEDSMNDLAVAYRQAAGGPKEILGQIDGLPTLPEGVSVNGRTIVGQFWGPWFSDIFGGRHLGPRRGAFVWRDGQNPPFQQIHEDASPPEGMGSVRISANGRIILVDTGGLYVDDHGPIDLRQILAEVGAVDLRAIPAGDFRATSISEDGLNIVGSVVVDGVTRAWRVRFSDCDTDGVADEIEHIAYGPDTSRVIAEGSERFQASRETLGYGDMISQYGRPWKPGKDRVPERDLTQPAEFLRATLSLTSCVEGGAVITDDSADRYLAAVALPAAQELQASEMLLGNEAFSDAIDPTIGLDGIPANDLGNQFAFKGSSGIQDLLDEELMLLRGRELTGSPPDWVNETLYYPEFMGTGGATARVAVYNRLPPNAAGAGGAAYRSNYAVLDNHEAAVKFPQGHGDAYGHYLSALKTGIGLLKEGPSGWPEDYLINIARMVTDVDAGLETVRRIAEAAVARAQSAAQVTELLHRRDYHENSEDPRALELFSDPDPERAWSMGDWARRGALGAYLDWAVVAHWAPTDETRPVNRVNLAELRELAGAVSGFQGSFDTAGAGLDPLGLAQNVVPFGIDASGLEPGSGRSHYEQVRDAASRALENARKAFENANQANQRLRDSDKALDDFTNKLEDTRVDKYQQLIEIFGLASPDDPGDNDLDPATDDFTESQSRPDRTSFFLDEEALAAQGMRPRLSPGQVELAMSELRVATLRIEQADFAIDDMVGQIRDQMDRIALVEKVQFDRINIITKAGNDQIELTRRLEEIEKRKKSAALVGSWVKAVALAKHDPSVMVDFIGQLVTEAVTELMLDETAFDIEVERIRVQTWKEISLQELEDLLSIEAEYTQLRALLRRSPQLLLDRAAAVEVASQALGRMQQAMTRGRLLLKDLERLEARTRGDLLEERWKDMAFRLYRNAALKNYRAFFDIAARYVILAARAYAYEFDARSDGEDVLAGIYRERRLGGASGLDGGLQSVINRLDGAVTVNNFNRPLETLGERTFSFRRNLLGIGVGNFPNDDLEFRAFLESNIIDRVEDIPEVRDLAQVSVERDYGPAIVVPFSTEIDSRNFFGRGPELPFGNSNFSLTRNAKIRSFAIRLDGVDASLGTDPESGSVFAYLLPVGDSVLRENTNRPRIEDELIRPWAVVDQFLPTPPLASTADFSKRSYNAWRSTGQVGGNFLNEIKRQRDCEARIELGQPQRFNTNLAGRSAWNTRWLLIIPGSQWTSGSDPAEIRGRLLQFIYGPESDPSRHVGITDVRLIIQAYSH